MTHVSWINRQADTLTFTTVPNYFTSRMRLTQAYWGRRREQLRRVWRDRERPTWGLDLVFAVLDLVGVCDLYEAVSNSLGRHVRPLHPWEVQILEPYFGNSVPYHLIRIDERAHIGPRQKRFYYVSFFTINTWQPMPDYVLVHEVVHIWQYLQRGAAYIPRALYAQSTPMGYNYGGLGALDDAYELEDFNYEQQADIIEDAYRLANGYPAQWAPGRGAEVLPYFQSYLAEIRAANYRAW